MCESHVQVVVVYLAEAHAKDQWPVGASVSFCDAPQSMRERVDLASKLYLDPRNRRQTLLPTGGLLGGEHGAGLSTSVPVLVDSTRDDAFLNTYSAWPLRFYGLVPEPHQSGTPTTSSSSSSFGFDRGNGRGWRLGFKANPHEDDLVYHFSDLEQWVAENHV